MSDMLTIRDFLNLLYGDEHGYVYAPYKKTTGEFEKYWYQWPSDAAFMDEDLVFDKSNMDVYLSPVLFNSKDTKDFKVSNVVWVDFDDGTPDQLGDFPSPAIRIESSNSSRKQHWYWRLDRPCVNASDLERYNKQLAYALDGDKGCWNFGRVLRPPFTLNHKYSPPAPVSLVELSDRSIDTYVFKVLPEPLESSLGTFSYTPRQGLYPLDQKPFTEVFWEWFRTPKVDGERHTALTSVAITCLEAGLNKQATMDYVMDADRRWGKYVGRSDREERLKQIVLYAENKLDIPWLTEVKKEGLESAPQPLDKFIGHKFNVEWVLDGLLHCQGLGIVTSPPGVGKTQFSLNLALSIANGTGFLHWKVNKPRKCLFLSLEMMQPELKFYLDQMLEEYPDKDRLNENIHLVARQAFRLNSEQNQRQLLEWIDEIHPEGIFIDSLSRCVGGDLEKGEIDSVFDFINSEIRDKRKCFVWFVHHNRKGNFNQQQPKKLEDMYGSQYIGAYASSVIGLWKNAGEIEVNCLKVWLSAPFRSFLMQRTDNLTFTARKPLEY